EPPLKRDHDGIGMAALDFGREFAILFDVSRQWLFEENSLPGPHQHCGVLAMIRGGGDDYRGIADAGLGKFFDRIENGNVAASLTEDAPGAVAIGIGDSYEAAAAG